MTVETVPLPADGTDDDLHRLLDHTKRELPANWPAWPGGWPDQAELALIDAVLSIRAKYGRRADTGVRRSVSMYREHRRPERPDDLNVLAAFDPEHLAEVLGNRQKTGGLLKTEAIVTAAGRLAAAGASRAADLKDTGHALKSAYVGVHGLGPVTWEYFLMLLGQPGVKADVWIVRFVEQGLGRALPSREVGVLMKRAAGELKVSPTNLDYVIWRHTSRKPHAGGPSAA